MEARQLQEKLMFIPAGDRNEWGRIDKRYTRHSLCGIPGANGKARFSHKPCCGIVGHGGKYYLPLRLGSLELEWTIVSDGTLPVVVPTRNREQALQTDREGYYFTAGRYISVVGTQQFVD